VDAVIGRAHELERMHDVVARGGALALVGEPGIGKTVLLEQARRHAGVVLETTGGRG
jgi:ATP-dependent Clp protease ATP-binding subunit ClpA